MLAARPARLPAAHIVDPAGGVTPALTCSVDTSETGTERRFRDDHANPGLLANFITLPALTSILGIGAGFATLAGGYNYAMFSKAMKRADDAESRLQYERQLRDEEREQEKAERQQEKAEREQEKAERQRMQERYEQRIDELLAALAEERRQAVATQQAMTDAITRLLEQRQNSDADPAGSQ